MINLIIADQSVVISGVRSIFENNDEIKIYSYFEDSTSLMKYLQSNFDLKAILLLDITFQNNSGLSIAKQITSLYKDIKVVFFSQFDDPMTLMFSFRNGAAAFLNKNLSGEELINSLELINKGELNFFYNKTGEFQQ